MNFPRRLLLLGFALLILGGVFDWLTPPPHQRSASVGTIARLRSALNKDLASV
jgi:hypothetical protein